MPSSASSLASLPAPSWRDRGPGVLLALAIAWVSYWLATLPRLQVIGPLTVALLVGMALRATCGLPAAVVAGTRFSARSVLRLGIVLLGVRLDFARVQQAGPRVLLLDLAVIVAGLVGITLLARRLGVPKRLPLLLAVGTSICGASAVVAAGTVTRSEEEEVTLAVGLCGLLGTVGAVFYILVGPLLGLSVSQLAVLSGSTLHEVAQVTAAAFSWGAEAGNLGTLVKLTRVVLLAPTIVVLGLIVGGAGRVRYSWREPPIPWFVIGFLAMGMLRWVGLLRGDTADWLAKASVLLMTVAMAAMGLNTPLQMLRQAGMRVIYAGLAGFAGLALLSWGLIHLLAIA